MFRKIIITTVLLLSSSFCVSAQVREQLQLHHINTKGYAVRVCYRDVNGIMWLGTTSGLLSLPQLDSRNPSGYHRYLGDVNMSIKKISGDGEGRLWIKTIYNDNYFYDPQRNEFVEDTPAMLSKVGVDVSHEFTVLTDSKDNTLIWKDDKLYKWARDASQAEVVSVGSGEQLRAISPVGKHLITLSQKSLFRLSTPVRQWADAGGLVQLMWHFNVPANEAGSTGTSNWNARPENTTFKASNALKEGTWENKVFYEQKGIDNLIWIWTTQNYGNDSSSYDQDTAWYPGDQYVDMVARDLYGRSAADNLEEFTQIQQTYPNKMVALGECGYNTSSKSDGAKIGDLWEAGAKWSHFMVWYEGNYGSTGTMASDNWWKDAMKADCVITRDQLPK